MQVISDAKKAVRLITGAVALRGAARRVRRRGAEHASGRFRIAVHFADSDVNMYQIRQWYGPLADIADRWPVVVIARSAVGAEALLDDGALPVAYLPRIADVEEFLADQDIAIVLYVNQNMRNFPMLRYGRQRHVFINHGESDKVYMISNQHKAYDDALVAGRAAQDRLSAALRGYDVERRTIAIGRPQVDHYPTKTPFPDDDRTVVLYAPTWEGDRASMRYGSVRTHGERLVRELLATGRHRVIYRPHPRTGVAQDAYAAAHRRIVAAIRAANAADPSAHHVHDDGPDVGWQLVAADVAVLDVSAMIYDRLAVGRPLLVTRPVDPEARIAETGYLTDCEWLPADAADMAAEIDRVRTDDRAVRRLSSWSRYYFGDTTPGAATRRFRAAIERLLSTEDPEPDHS